MSEATLGRDIVAAISEHLHLMLSSKYPVWFEGSGNDLADSETPTRGIEVRIDGPSISVPSKGTMHAVVEVDLLITLPVKGDIYAMSLALGDCTVALRSGIPIVDLDTEQPLGCLETFVGRRGEEHIRVHNYGEIDGDTPAMHGTVATNFILKTQEYKMAQVDLKLATIKIKDGGANEITVKIGEGNLTYNETRNVEYTLDKGKLDGVKLGDEVPVDVSLDATWESITGVETNADVTVATTAGVATDVTLTLTDSAATPVQIGSMFVGADNVTHQVTESTATEITFTPALTGAVALGALTFLPTVVTIEDALKQRRGAASWVTTDADACNPYCVDIEVAMEFPCALGTGQDENILLKTFRYESIAHDLGAGTLALSGKCNITEAEATRV